MKSPSSIIGQEGHILRVIIISSMMEETFDKEESKLDPLGLCVYSSLAVTEGGLILKHMPPSATHPKNT
jgi:hypothetical protein